MSSLSPKQRKYLKGLAHHYSPVVQVGAKGITENVVQAAEDALTAHELIKAKVARDVGVDRKSGIEELAERTGSTAVAVIGRVWILYRPRPEDPRIQLP